MTQIRTISSYSTLFSILTLEFGHFHLSFSQGIHKYDKALRLLLVCLEIMPSPNFMISCTENQTKTKEHNQPNLIPQSILNHSICYANHSNHILYLVLVINFRCVPHNFHFVFKLHAAQISEVYIHGKCLFFSFSFFPERYTNRT